MLPDAGLSVANGDRENVGAKVSDWPGGTVSRMLVPEIVANPKTPKSAVRMSLAELAGVTLTVTT